MSQRVLIFANPIAGRGGARHLADKLKERLTREGWDVQLLSNLHEKSASQIEPARAAIVIGGDGTLRSVAQEFMRDETSDPPPLLPVPMGTANVMGRHLGVKWTELSLPDQVAAALRKPNIQWLDAGTSNGNLFLLMAGVGLDARIVHELDRLRNGPITRVSYAIPAAYALGWYDYPPLTVEVDGETIISDVPAMALVCNVAEYGLGVPFLPDARADDGVLDICVLPFSSRAQAISLFLHVTAGEHLEAEGVRNLTGKKISIRSSRPAPVQLDGEAAGHTPIEIGLLPRRVPFIVLSSSNPGNS